LKIDGRVLDPICRNPGNPDRVSDEVLRWHFRQSVLANMRGAGEPVFETDFPPGTDMMATLRAEPCGKERFEMELASRLRIMPEDDEVRDLSQVLVVFLNLLSLKSFRAALP
jgi:hypothetical protein